MLCEITNTSGRTINALDEHDGGSGATGGARTDPLPYPFSHIYDLADTETMELPMHPADWRHRSSVAAPFEAGAEWNTLVQRGVVTMAFSAQTGVRDPESLAIDTI